MVFSAVTITSKLYVVCCHFVCLTCTVVCRCFKAMSAEVDLGESPSPHLFLDQTEAQRTEEKKLLRLPPPPLISEFGWPPSPFPMPPNLLGWIHHWSVLWRWVRYWNWKTIKFCELKLWISARIIVFTLDTQCKFHLLSRRLEVGKIDSAAPCFIESFHSKVAKVEIPLWSHELMKWLFVFFPQLNQVSPQQTDVIEHHYKVYERLQKIRAETEEVSVLFECCYCFVSFFRCLWGSTHWGIRELYRETKIAHIHCNPCLRKVILIFFNSVEPPPFNGHLVLLADSPYIHSCFNPSTTATSLQWPLSSVPKVAIVERFNCAVNSFRQILSWPSQLQRVLSSVRLKEVSFT